MNALNNRPTLIGTADFLCPITGNRMTIVPVYEGETPHCAQVVLRAERHLDIECIPDGLYPGNRAHIANIRYYPSSSQR